MHIALRFFLLTAAAVAAGVMINLILLYLFRNQDFQHQLESLKRLGVKLRNPLKDQIEEYSDLHHAVSLLENHKKIPREQTSGVDFPPSSVT